MGYLQSASLTQGTTSATIPLAYATANLTSGSLLWCAVFWGSATQTCTVADNTPQTWIPLGSPQRGTGNLAAFSSQMFYFPNNASVAKPTVTATCSSTNANRGIAIGEWSSSNQSPGVPLYKNVNGTTVVTDLVAIATGDVAMAMCIAGTSVASVSAPFTQRENANFGTNSIADDVTVNASIACTFNVNVDDNMCGIVAFAAGSVVVPPRQVRMPLGV